MRPITVSAPEDCILNALHPWPTGGRHSVGHFVVPLLMGALAPALPDKVQADAAMMNVFSVKGRHRDGEDVSSLFFSGRWSWRDERTGWARGHARAVKHDRRADRDLGKPDLHDD